MEQNHQLAPGELEYGFQLWRFQLLEFGSRAPTTDKVTCLIEIVAQSSR